MDGALKGWELNLKLTWAKCKEWEILIWNILLEKYIFFEVKNPYPKVEKEKKVVMVLWF